MDFQKIQNSDFDYGHEWYNTNYHKGLFDPKSRPPELGVHWERDLECVDELGLNHMHSILICGCGGGNNIVMIRQEYGKAFLKQITAVDFSLPAVRYCKFWFSEIKAVVASVENLPFATNTFDRLLALDVTEHLPFDVYLHFIYDSYRVLKPGGKAAVLPGMTKQLEHINLLPTFRIRRDMRLAGYEADGDKGWIIGTKATKVPAERQEVMTEGEWNEANSKKS